MASVAIIGAGPAGLCTARHLKNHPKISKLTIFEAKSEIGGIWAKETNFLPKNPTKNDIKNFTSTTPVYDNLYTNLPDLAQMFPDYLLQMEKGKSRYVTTGELLEYLNGYCDKFGLRELVEFDTLVVEVGQDSSQEPRESGSQYFINTKNTKSGLTKTHTYDKVIICNGHTTKKYYSDLDLTSAQKIFQGDIIHAADYKNAKAIATAGYKKVVVIGGYSSAMDIIIELNEVEGVEAILSTYGPLKLLKLSEKYCNAPRKFTKTGFVDKCGNDVECDLIICATGYKFDFPFFAGTETNQNFLEQKVGLQQGDKFLKNLYFHIFPKNPNFIENLAFIGLNKNFVTFPFFDMQVRLLKYFWFEEEGNEKFQKIIGNPSQIEAYLEKEISRRNNRGFNLSSTNFKKYHDMDNDLQELYFQDIDEILGQENLPENLIKVRNLGMLLFEWSKVNLLTKGSRGKFSVIEDVENIEKIKEEIQVKLGKMKELKAMMGQC